MTTAQPSSRLIRFALRSLDEIEPWGEPDNLSLSWFALTDGYYLVTHGDSEIYRYSPTALSTLGWTPGPTPEGFENSVDYQVCRLFHDLAEIIPSVVEEVPSDVATLLDTTSTQKKWEQTVDDWDWESASDSAESLLWVDHRTLDSGYLQAGPDITFWRTGDAIRIRCDNRTRQVDGVQIWQSERMDAEVPLSEFLAEIRHFGDDLLAKMDERVKLVEAGWKREGVTLDPKDLRKQQVDNASLWSAALGSAPRTTDWSLVRAAMNR